MRLIGAAERALSLAATRALDRVAFGAPLAAQVRARTGGAVISTRAFCGVDCCQQVPYKGAQGQHTLRSLLWLYLGVRALNLGLSWRLRLLCVSSRGLSILSDCVLNTAGHQQQPVGFRDQDEGISCVYRVACVRCWRVSVWPWRVQGCWC
jgi:hypothetical protein